MSPVPAIFVMLLFAFTMPLPLTILMGVVLVGIFAGHLTRGVR